MLSRESWTRPNVLLTLSDGAGARSNASLKNPPSRGSSMIDARSGWASGWSARRSCGTLFARQMIDKVIDIINYTRMDQPLTSGGDAGLFEHDPSGSYLHLLREVLLTYRLLMRTAAAEFGLSGAQLELLRQLALAGGRSSTSTLARELAVDPAAVTRLVAGLERVELVSREADERDGRRRPVLLTPAGRAMMIDFHARVHARESALAAEIEPDAVEAAMRVLQAIRSAVDAGVAHRPTSGGSRE